MCLFWRGYLSSVTLMNSPDLKVSSLSSAASKSYRARTCNSSLYIIHRYLSHQHISYRQLHNSGEEYFACLHRVGWTLPRNISQSRGPAILNLNSCQLGSKFSSPHYYLWRINCAPTNQLFFPPMHSIIMCNMIIIKWIYRKKLKIIKGIQCI